MATLEARMARWFGDLEPTHPGTGWISGTVGVFLGALTVVGVLCFHFPALLTTPELRAAYPVAWMRRLLAAGIVLAFTCGLLSTLLRRRKVLGVTAMGLALLAVVMGGSGVPVDGPVGRSPYLGLDWFALSLLFTALVFAPLERAWPLRPAQSAFRPEWLTDGAYFFASHALVQVLSALILVPATLAAGWLALPGVRAWVGAWPALVQLVVIVIVADLTQYWVHRAFHRSPWLWRFHRVHHSSETLDWLAGSRLHLVDVVVTRGLVLVPLVILGFDRGPLLAYLTFVSVHAVFIHANFAPRAAWLEACVVLPRFHHWHHATAPEAVDRNFAVHLPWLDRLFGTAWLPEGRWPERYGVLGMHAPAGFVAQLLWPFRGA